jgi:hypothetical protein
MPLSRRTPQTRRPHPRRRSRIALVVLLVLFINLPILHSTWTRWRVDRVGVEATFPLADHEVMTPGDDPRYWVGFRYPEQVDADRNLWAAEVDEESYDEAVAAGQLQVRYLEGRPSAYEVEGQVRHWLGTVTTLVADLVLLLIVLLVWRFGGRTRPLPLRMAAIGDVERCPPGQVLEQVEGDLWLVRGEVAGIEDDEIVLEVGDQDVLVILDGHTNPVGYQQPAQVRGRMLD